MPVPSPVAAEGSTHVPSLPIQTRMNPRQPHCPAHLRKQFFQPLRWKRFYLTAPLLGAGSAITRCPQAPGFHSALEASPARGRRGGPGGLRAQRYPCKLESSCKRKQLTTYMTGDRLSILQGWPQGRLTTKEGRIVIASFHRRGSFKT